MNPLLLLSQEKHDHYFNRATSEEVCIAVLFLHFFVRFLPFLLKKCIVFYTQPAFITKALNLAFQANLNKIVIFLFSPLEKLNFHKHIVSNTF